MSLILEALEKLEREKQVPDRGVVVVASAPWRVPQRSPLLVAAAVALVAGVAAAAMALGWLMASRNAPDAPPRPAAAAAPAAAPPTWVVHTPAVTPTLLPAPAAATTRPPHARTPPPATTLAPAPPASTALRLTAISQQDGVPVAMVNDTLVREGDTLGDVTIVRIGADSIEVEVGGVRRVVTF